MTSLGKINKRQNLNDCVQLQDIKQRDFILFQSPPSIFMADGNTSNHVIMSSTQPFFARLVFT